MACTLLQFNYGHSMYNLVRYRYQTIEFGDTDIHIRTLKNNLQFSDKDGVARDIGISSASWPLFGILWDSGHLLANLMYHYEINGKRILEVGCGIGLASMVLNQRNADITATDHHPEAEAFLLVNTKLNDDRTIPFFRTAWIDNEPSLGQFDIIIGSDILYERNHAEQLADFINEHSRHNCEVILVDPGRGNQASFNRYMKLLGFNCRKSKPEKKDDLIVAFKGHILGYKR